MKEMHDYKRISCETTHKMFFSLRHKAVTRNRVSEGLCSYNTFFL